MSPGEWVGFIGGIVAICGTLFIWFRGGFKKSINTEEAIDSVKNLESLATARGIQMESVFHRLNALEKDNLEIKRNYQNSSEVLASKIDDMNKHIMDLTFKLGTVVGQNGNR